MPTPDEVIICEELIELWDNMNWDHVRAVEIDSATTILAEGYLIPEARIPSLAVLKQNSLSKIHKTRHEFRDLEAHNGWEHHQNPSRSRLQRGHGVGCSAKTFGPTFTAAVDNAFRQRIGGFRTTSPRGHYVDCFAPRTTTSHHYGRVLGKLGLLWLRSLGRQLAD